MSRYGPMRTASGAVLQSGLPKSAMTDGAETNFLVRGVVTATYVYDDSDHPYATTGPAAVYCDVLVYTAMAGGRVYPLYKALVSQDSAGIQGGAVWVPRATTGSTAGSSLNPGNASSDFSAWDGDHVLVGFIDHNRQQAVILRSLPHPRADVGIGLTAPPGRRQRLRKVDGRVDLRRHQGVYWGADAQGNWVADAAGGNAGNLTPVGGEVPGVPGQSGNVTMRVGAASARKTTVVQQVGDVQTVLATELFTALGLNLTFVGPGGFTVAGAAGPLMAIAAPGAGGGAGAATAGITIGNGGTKAARASSVADALNAILTWLATHTHQATGPTSPTSVPLQVGALPSRSTTDTLAAAGLSLPV